MGWVVWRDCQSLPDSLIFKVSYLGGTMPTFALNFSRPGAQILLQYWAFLRYGFEGYKKVQGATSDVARYLANEIKKIGPFELWNDASDIPVFAWMMKKDQKHNWGLYDLSDRLRMKGWLIPAYPMPTNLTDLTVQRIVVRNGLGMDLADQLINDMKTEVAYLEKLDQPLPENHRSGFHH